MEYGKIDEPHFVVCLEGGDEIHDSLVAFVEKEHITFGMIQGIGTVREVTLGFFHTDAPYNASFTLLIPFCLSFLSQTGLYAIQSPSDI